MHQTSGSPCPVNSSGRKLRSVVAAGVSPAVEPGVPPGGTGCAPAAVPPSRTRCPALLPKRPWSAPALWQSMPREQFRKEASVSRSGRRLACRRAGRPARRHQLRTRGRVSFQNAFPPRCSQSGPGVHQPAGSPWPLNSSGRKLRSVVAAGVPPAVEPGVPPGGPCCATAAVPPSRTGCLALLPKGPWSAPALWRFRPSQQAPLTLSASGHNGGASQRRDRFPPRAVPGPCTVARNTGPTTHAWVLVPHRRPCGKLFLRTRYARSGVVVAKPPWIALGNKLPTL